MVAVGYVLDVSVRWGVTTRVHTLVVDQIERRGEELVYRLRDDDGPALLIRESRLAKLGWRLQPASHPPLT